MDNLSLTPSKTIEFIPVYLYKSEKFNLSLDSAILIIINILNLLIIILSNNNIQKKFNPKKLPKIKIIIKNLSYFLAIATFVKAIINITLWSMGNKYTTNDRSIDSVLSTITASVLWYKASQL